MWPFLTALSGPLEMWDVFFFLGLWQTGQMNGERKGRTKEWLHKARRGEQPSLWSARHERRLIHQLVQGKSRQLVPATVLGTAGVHWSPPQPLKVEMGNARDNKALILTAFLEHKIHWCVKCKQCAFWTRRGLLPELWTLGGREEEVCVYMCVCVRGLNQDRLFSSLCPSWLSIEESKADISRCVLNNLLFKFPRQKLSRRNAQ